MSSGSERLALSGEAPTSNDERLTSTIPDRKDEPRPEASNPYEERAKEDGLTPMMRQYLGVKAAHPGSIVLFRMGDFFETFFEDAIECSKILDITLTARSKEKDIPMAGVPHHAIDGYLARLIEAKRSVVFVDQIEDPKQAKGLVRRAVTRVVSPGTFVDPNASARSASYLVGLAFESSRKRSSRWGLAALDLSTGEFRATAGDDAEVLFDEIARLDPREILVAEGKRSDERVGQLLSQKARLTITFRPDAEFEIEHAKTVLTEAFGADELRGFKTSLSDASLVAAAAALHFARETQLRPEAVDVVGRASLQHVETLRPYLPGHALVLDAQAREHLEIFRAQDGSREGALLESIDAAVTAMGGRLLAKWLAYPLADIERIRARQEAIEQLVDRPSILDRIRENLEAVSDLERVVGRIVLGRATPRDLAAVRDTLLLAPKVLALAAECVGVEHKLDLDLNFDRDRAHALPRSKSLRNGLLPALARTDCLEEIGAQVDIALVEKPSLDLASGEVFKAGYDPEFDEIENIAQNGKQLIAALEIREREATGIHSLKVRYNRVFGYYIEVTKANLKLVPDRYIRKQTTVNSERFFTEELKALETKVLNADEQRAARARFLFSELVSGVAVEVSRLRALARALAEIDVLGGLAHIAEKRAWVKPAINEDTAIDIVEGRHPVIELRSSALGERFVPNDMFIDAEQRLVIITGPNMAGKSTIMRQTALLVILAHVGSFVPAQRATIGIVDRIFTRVGASDDLSRGRSTFMVEMNETARILRSATDRSLILLDEIGRGTSTFDGLSIAWAVAEHLHDTVRAKTLFATHYHELTEICRDKKHAVNRHVAVKEWKEGIIFLRKLMPGATNRSYGVQVARLAGLPAPVLDRARTVLDSLEARSLVAGDQSPVAFLLRNRQPGVGGAVGPAPEEPDSGQEQLHLFSGPSAAVAAGREPAVDQRVIETLAGLELDDLTPRQVFEIVARLQQELRA